MNLFCRCSVCGSDNHPGATCEAAPALYSPKRQPTGAEKRHLNNALYMHGVSCMYFSSNPHLAKNRIFLKYVRNLSGNLVDGRSNA